VSRRSIGALALALGLGATASCGGGSDGSHTSHRSGTTTTTVASHNVLVMGDSNVYNSSAVIDRTLRGAGFVPTVHGVPGYGVKDAETYWLPKLRELLADNPTVVVVALGTNDTRSAASVQAVAGHIDEIMRALGRRHVIWITHVDDNRFAIPNGGRIVNDTIRAAMKRWQNLTVLDLAPDLAAHPELLQDDHLHYSASGMQFYAFAITEAVKTAIRIRR
jgi:lysophospholipase L1-like esterase